MKRHFKTNQMITAVIIDDEKHCINTLTKIIKTHFNESIHLLGSAQSIEDGADIIRKYQPQLVFLDVEINDKSGFDLLEQLSPINFEVIFTTAYDKYAIEAFNISAIYYLLKPIEADKLQEAIEKLKDKISKEDLNKKIETLFFNHDQNNTIKRISIPTAKGYDFIQMSEIIRCEAAGNYSNIHVENRKLPYNVAKTLNYYDELLTKYNFCRTHKSHLVNMRYVKSYNRKEDTATLTDNSEIPVSIRLKDDFLKTIQGKI